MSRSLLIASVYCLLLLAPVSTGAQTEPPQEEIPELLPIPEGQILGLADLVAADVRRIEARLPDPAGIRRIAGALPALENEVVLLLTVLDQLDPTRVSARRVEDQRAAWLTVRDDLRRWTTVVAARFDSLQSEQESLREERSRWQLTKETFAPGESSEDLLRRIDTTLGRVAEVEAKLREQRNEIGSLGDRIASSLEETTNALERLDELERSMWTQLLERNSPPIWQLEGMGASGTTSADWVVGFGDWAQSLRIYLELRRARLVGLVLGFGFLVILVLRVRRASSEWPQGDKSLDLARRVVARPISLAFVVTMVVFSVASPYRPGAVIDLLLVLEVLAIIRLGWVVVPTHHRLALTAIGFLTILGRFGSILSDSSLIKRVLYLLIAVTALVIAAKSASRARGAVEDRQPWARITLGLASLSTALFAVASVADIFGRVALSSLLTQATLHSLLSFLAWTIVILTTEALVPAVLRGSLGSVLPGLSKNSVAVRRALVRAVTLLATISWVVNTLARFQIWTPVRSWIVAKAGAELKIGGLALSIDVLLAAVLVLIVTRWIAQFVRFILCEEVLPRLQLSSGTDQSVVTLANYFVYGLGVVLAASAMGLSGTQLTVVIGALGVGIGFGLQNIVNNFISGLILIFGRPIRVGDSVQTSQHFGRVVRIGIRASTIRSFEGAEIIVPNGELISKEVINWTRSDEIRRLEVLVGVAYGTNPEVVMEILRQVACEHELVLSEPAPQVHMTAFGDSSLDFRLRFWARFSEAINVASDLHIAINRELKESRVEIPFPQRDLHLKSLAFCEEDLDEVKSLLGERDSAE